MLSKGPRCLFLVWLAGAETGELGFLIVFDGTRGFPENEGIATGGDAEVGRKDGGRLK